MTATATSTLRATARAMVQAPKVILAADESTGTMGDRLSSVGLPNTAENRNAFRRLLFTTAGIEDYVAATILFEETLANPELVELLTSKGIIPVVKIDQGLVDYGPNGEKIVKGFFADKLAPRLELYARQGARATKFRSLFSITDNELQLPTDECILLNAFAQAEFARICQSVGLVPMVEPEVDFKGTHDIGTCEDASCRVLASVFARLKLAGIDFEGMILKPSMVTSGQSAENRAGSHHVAMRTVRTLLSTVPSEVAGVAFLSGGQGDEEADENLAAIARHGREQMSPFRFTASFGRGLQRSALKTWGGDDANIAIAQAVFIEKCRQTSEASVA